MRVGLGECERVVKSAIAERNRDYLLRAAIALTMGVVFGAVMAFLLFMLMVIFLGVNWSATIVGALALAGFIAAVRGQDPIHDPSDMGFRRFQVASTSRLPIEPFALVIESVRLVRSRIGASGRTVQQAASFMSDAFCADRPRVPADDAAAQLLVRLQLAKVAHRGQGYELTIRARERLTGA
jgi:hypothetical protein